MTPTRKGSIRIFRLFGIDVFLHWSWFLVAVYSISDRIPNYSSPVWGVLEYVALFAIVLMHEFGHSLACRSVGGTSDQIVLWPLGGVAYVAPPSRPGATLWSIAAGPLVNVALLPVIWTVGFLCARAGWTELNPDFRRFLTAVAYLNLVLLCFNLVPVYPLDGGQILRALLWFPLGKARSLLIATVIGFVGGAGLIALAVRYQSIWFGIMAFFLLSNCWQSFQHAKALRRLEQLPRHREFSCPACKSSPPVGAFWRCEACGQPFDVFATQGTCPKCSAMKSTAPCVDCGASSPLTAWQSRAGVLGH
ncbi:MAG: site-2 protease family protein [Opitutus sp.]